MEIAIPTIRTENSTELWQHTENNNNKKKCAMETEWNETKRKEERLVEIETPIKRTKTIVVIHSWNVQETVSAYLYRSPSFLCISFNRQFVVGYASRNSQLIMLHYLFLFSNKSIFHILEFMICWLNFILLSI